MGVSAGSGQQSGSNSFLSTPINLQNPNYTNLAPGTTTGIQNAQNIQSWGLGGPNNLSPYSGAYGAYSNTGGNPLVANTTGQQNNFLNNVGLYGNPSNSLNTGAFGSASNMAQMANSNPYGPAGGQLGLASGSANAIAANMAPWATYQGGTPGQVMLPAYGAAQNMLDPNYAANLASSPQTQQAISSAVNPLINSFNSQTVPGLQGMFTAAGQRTNTAAGPGTQGSVGGSSAFDIAGANAMRGLETSIGQVSGGIANQAYQTGLQQQSQAINQIGNLAGTQANIYGNVANEVMNATAGQAGAQNQVAQTSEGIINNQLGALANSTNTSQGLLTSDMNNTINGLNASALPQLTQQYGINQGLQLYQNQVNTLMTALGLGGQVSQPAIGNIAGGSGSSSGSSNSKGFSL